MRQVKLTDQWVLVGTLAALVQFRSNSNASVEVYIGDTPDSISSFILDNNQMFSLNTDSSLWARTKSGNGVAIVLEG